jgi:hypothetical protein
MLISFTDFHRHISWFLYKLVLPVVVYSKVCFFHTSRTLFSDLQNRN